MGAAGRGGRARVEGRGREGPGREARGRERLTVDAAFARRGGAPPLVGAPNVELLDGVLVRRSLPEANVVAAVVGLASEFDRAAPGLEVGVRAPLASHPYDVLRPEVSLLRPLAPHLRRPAPGPEAVVLAVLVGDDAAETARRARRCGAAGICELWMLAPRAGHGVRLSAPRGGVYTARELLLPGETVAPHAAPWLRVVAVAGARAARPASAERARGAT